MADVKVEIPLDEVLSRRYLRLKSYFDDFIDKVESSNVNTSEYVAIVTIQKKDEPQLDRSTFGSRGPLE